MRLPLASPLPPTLQHDLIIRHQRRTLGEWQRWRLQPLVQHLLKRHHHFPGKGIIKNAFTVNQP